MDRQQIMNLFRGNGFDELTNDDRLEIFFGILAGSSDLTALNLETLCQQYGTNLATVIDKAGGELLTK